jgi:TMEM175 potassium channel family protein
MDHDADDDVLSDGTPAHHYRRRSEELEFDRVAFFSDAVFAIAMTLLVVGIGVPHVADSKLRDALSGRDAEIFSFFLSFVVIGFFWLAHHRFVARLVAVDRRFMQINLLYLAAIAFTPFPTAIVGIYGGDEPAGVVLYAVTLGAASFLEAALLWHAQHEGLLRARMRDDVFRGNMAASLAPVVVFAISIPIAYFATSWGLLSWLLIFPLEWCIGRYVIPKDADPF